MKAETISTVYARALLEAAADGGELETVREEAAFLASRLRLDDELRLFIESPGIERGRRKDSLERTLRGRVSDIFLDFLLVVVRRGRTLFLLDALERFGALYDEKVGRVKAEATTAVPMSPEVAATLEGVMGSALGKDVVLTQRVEPEILGGLVVRFAGMVADGSLRSALEEIREDLSAVKFTSELVHEDQP